MVCQNCGSVVENNSVICPYCGSAIKSTNVVKEETKGSKVFHCIMSFLIPLYGIIVTCLFWRSRHETAKACLVTTIVSYVLSLIFMSNFY